MKKGLLKIEDIRPGRMILIHGINDNVIISHLSYFGVYQEKQRMQDL